MSRESSLKEEIGWLKVVFGIFIATDISLMAWASQNYSVVNPFILGAAVFAILMTSVAIYLINAAAFRRMRQMENI